MVCASGTFVLWRAVASMETIGYANMYASRAISYASGSVGDCATAGTLSRIPSTQAVPIIVDSCMTRDPPRARRRDCLPNAPLHHLNRGWLPRPVDDWLLSPIGAY